MPERLFGQAAIDDRILPFWRDELGISSWPGEDVFSALFDAFVGAVEVSDGAARAMRDGPVIFIANHQVAIESLVFVFAVGGIGRRHIRALAKQAHQTSWVGEMLGLLNVYPGQIPAPPSYFRDEYDPQSLVDMLAEMRRGLAADGHSLLIHAEGARVLDCRRSVSQVSSVFVDLARETGVPIVPVRFANALPVETMDNYLDFPFGFCRQTYHLGEPVTAADLAAAHPRDRRPMVTAAINATGVPAAEEVPSPPNLPFRRGVQDFMSETATSQVKAVLVTALRALEAPLPETRRMLDSLRTGSMAIGDTPAESWLGQFCGWLSDGRTRVRRQLAQERAAI